MSSFEDSGNPPNKNLPKTARNVVDIALQTVTAVRNLVPLEAAKGPLSVLCSLLTLLQMHWQNEDDLKDIAECCTRVALIMERTAGNEDDEGNKDLFQAAERLRKLVAKISKQILKKGSRKTWRKALNISQETVEISELKESLTSFIIEFQLDTSITMSLDVRAILRWVQAQEGRTGNPTNAALLYTPPKPMIFCGRESIVKDIVNTLLLPRQMHIALIGPGGIGKTTISKAILNEEHVSTMFSVRLFITYDTVDYALMNYDTFVGHLADALQISTPNRIAILNRLKLLRTALIVIDNAETFVEAGYDGFRDISQMLDEMGTLCRIIFTTRNTDTVPANLFWNRIYVEKLDVQAAIDAFASVYDREPINLATKNILLELECHPLSINILANVAVFNSWPLEQLELNWQTQQRSRLLETRKDRYHSLPVAIDLSISCSDFNEARDQVMKLLRALAFLPQGIHRRDLEGILQDDSAISTAESLCRCSLAYWQSDRLVVLSPIRMYIMEKYNSNLCYTDELVNSIRRHYYSQIDWKVGHCGREEHANLDRIFLFDLSRPFVQVDTLQRLWNFIAELYYHNPQPINLWSCLQCAQSEAELSKQGTFNNAKASAMIWMSTLYAKMDRHRTSFEITTVAEQLCRRTTSGKASLT